MQSFLQSAFAALVICTLLTGASQAAIIYSQTSPEEPGAAYSSTDIPTVGIKIADNFVFSSLQDLHVRSLHVIGGYGIRNSGPPVTPGTVPDDNFRVVFFDDDNGQPGTPLANGDLRVGEAYSRSETGGKLLNGTTKPFVYHIDLGDGVALKSGNEYWVSITNNPGPSFGWSWARASGLLDESIASTLGEVRVGPWNAFSSDGMYFELNSANVPEPSCKILAFLAVAGCHCWFIGRGPSKTG